MNKRQRQQLFRTHSKKKPIAVIIFFLLSLSVFSQTNLPNTPDSIIENLLGQLNVQQDIDKNIAARYLNIDSFEMQQDPIIHSDSPFSFGSHTFWIVSYGAFVNCQYKRLIEYKTGSKVFRNRLLVETDCDVDFSTDHVQQTKFKTKGNILYVYENYYKIKDEDLVLVRKKSTYSAFRLPDLVSVFKNKPVP